MSQLPLLIYTHLVWAHWHAVWFGWNWSNILLCYLSRNILQRIFKNNFFFSLFYQGFDLSSHLSACPCRKVLHQHRSLLSLSNPNANASFCLPENQLEMISYSTFTLSFSRNELCLKVKVVKKSVKVCVSVLSGRAEISFIQTQVQGWTV